MTTRHELLELEDKGWRELSARFDRLVDEDWERTGASGEWSPRDVLAHIACWHAEGARFYEERRMGGTPRWPEIQRFNDVSHESCKDMSLHDVKVMSGAARHRFREEIAQVAEPLSDNDAKWIGDCGGGHYEEHIPLLDGFLAGR